MYPSLLEDLHTLRSPKNISVHPNNIFLHPKISPNLIYPHVKRPKIVTWIMGNGCPYKVSNLHFWRLVRWFQSQLFYRIFTSLIHRLWMTYNWWQILGQDVLLPLHHRGLQILLAWTQQVFCATNTAFNATNTSHTSIFHKRIQIRCILRYFMMCLSISKTSGKQNVLWRYRGLLMIGFLTQEHNSVIILLFFGGANLKLLTFAMYLMNFENRIYYVHSAKLNQL